MGLTGRGNRPQAFGDGAKNSAVKGLMPTIFLHAQSMAALQKPQ
jgi:hypothetical protein